MSSNFRSSTIKIGSRIYAIASIDDFTFDIVLNQRGIFDNNVKSFVDYDDQVILVRDRLLGDHKRELILHEIIHACIEDSGVKIEEAEMFISLLAPRLVQLISELPHIIAEVIP